MSALPLPVLPVRVVTSLVAIIVALLTGCTHAPQNQPLAAQNPTAGYRLANALEEEPEGDEIFVILALSGGGTRAAAFSYGTMEKLAATKITVGGRERSLLDEVDIISSVSGGSFTAVYYGLHRQDGRFAEFPDRFLHYKTRSALVRGVLNPFNWFRLASPHYDRIDLAADLYDRTVFEGKTFGDLAAIKGRPFIVLNATDMSLASRFEFTQDQFDFLGSDLSSYPIARGVAASSAFPILLSPITLTNHPTSPTVPWFEVALADRANNPRDFASAQALQSYGNKQQRKFVHLLDGGLSDNVGLRGPAYALFSTYHPWSKDAASGRPSSLVNLLNTKKIKHLVIITANAKVASNSTWDAKENAPGLAGVLSVVTTGPMGNYSSETVQYVHDQLQARGQLLDDPSQDSVRFYAIELGFEDIRDPERRDTLNAIPTDFQISREAVAQLRAAAAELLDQSEAFQELQTALRQNPP